MEHDVGGIARKAVALKVQMSPDLEMQSPEEIQASNSSAWMKKDRFHT